ncbi:MAG: hypothetical protein JST28_20340 [Acidobacteria bacterium]|nr:hypothetical protein [Acidobacteriota bacterium]
MEGKDEMAAARAETVEMASHRAELDSVLSSQEFVRAPRLAHLLSYLCEKTFAGETNQIKEYSIALEVFNRGASFDQDSDSIVRVEANRLRKRLAEYYAGEGATHAIQITIPVGQYVPRFEVRLKDTGEKEKMPATRPELAREKRWWTGPRIIALGGGTAVLLIATIWITYGVAKHRASPQSVVQPDEARVQSEIAGGQFGPPAGDEIRILAGATRSLVDHAGKLWSADQGFRGGTSVRSAAQHVGRTLEPAFYRTSRQGEFRYDIPLKSGIYEMRLHFAETVYSPDTTGAGGEGSRLMTVRANGQTLVSHFDVVGDAGASGTADVKVFAGLRPAKDGVLHLEFSGEEGKPAMVSGIEILPGVKGHIRPVRVLARQSPYYSNDSHWWSPDNYFEGGQLASYAQEVTGTDDPELYETERWGNFSYSVPVTPGRYSVTLHFAARRSKPGEPVGQGADHVANTFNVFCNGRALLENFQLAAEAGKKDVVIKRFSGLEPNAQGKLDFNFVPVDGHATLTGLEILPEGKDE